MIIRFVLSKYVDAFYRDTINSTPAEKIIRDYAMLVPYYLFTMLE